MIRRGKKKKLKYKTRRLPLKAPKSIDELHPQRSMNPSRKYFEKRKLETMPEHVQVNYFDGTTSSRGERDWRLERGG